MPPATRTRTRRAAASSAAARAAAAPEEGTLSSARNALRLLKQFRGGDHELGVSELAGRLGLAKSTVHRLLATLCAEGFARRTDDGRYALGFALWELGSRLVGGLELRTVAHPVLEALRDATDETVQLAVLDGAEVVYIDRVQSQATLQLFRRIGYRLPAHATSTGKAILAFSPAPAVAAVLEAGLPRLGPGTVTSARAFREALDRARADRFVISVEESESGVASAGAPIFDHRGEVVGALSIAGPLARLTPAVLPSLAKRVRKAAEEISAGLGHLPRAAAPR